MSGGSSHLGRTGGAGTPTRGRRYRVHVHRRAQMHLYHLHVNQLLHLPGAQGTMVHVHMHAHWQPRGDREPRPSAAEAHRTSSAGSAVSAPLWEELFMGASPVLAADPDVASCTLSARHESVRQDRKSVV